MFFVMLKRRRVRERLEYSSHDLERARSYARYLKRELYRGWKTTRVWIETEDGEPKRVPLEKEVTAP